MIGLGVQGDIMIARNGPTTTAAVAPPSPNGLRGWYTTAPTVTLTATAHDAPIASTYYSVDTIPPIGGHQLTRAGRWTAGGSPRRGMPPVRYDPRGTA